eukprot:821309-Rhodomonas_salina.1
MFISTASLSGGICFATPSLGGRKAPSPQLSALAWPSSSAVTGTPQLGQWLLVCAAPTGKSAAALLLLAELVSQRLARSLT